MSTQPSKKSTMQNLAKSLNISETKLLIAIKQLGLNPSEVNESWGDAIAQHLTGTKPQSLTQQPETEPAQSNEIDSLSLVAESDELDLAADNVAQNVSNGSSIRQGFIDSEINKTAAQAELLAHLNTATFADTYRRTMAENMAVFQEISDKNHDEFMTSIVSKFSELGKGNPNELPQKMSEKAQTQSQKTQAYTDKIRQNFNVKSWMN
ncbi:hypothetical protein [Planktothrix agardhii]|jgi:hypothetical protein|uniref:hypothetical protein n=1 Tax=Planktothrix agardhii TaxID=1160 RepID=UPI0028A58EFE|nr:hypothetical protein [Planktothrix agardhii]